MYICLRGNKYAFIYLKITKKTLLQMGRGVSGDQYGLADTLLQLALNGPAPNQLLLSLLNHSLATQVSFFIFFYV
jgi:hypothetical protein